MIGPRWMIVCPTYVGMNRGNGTRSGWKKRMPHVCGDEPDEGVSLYRWVSYAPHVWG